MHSIESLNNDDFEGSRISYISKIEKSFDPNNWLLPTAVQEKAYQEALTNLVHALYKDRNAQLPVEDILLSGCKERSRKDNLKEILNLLQRMQMKRLYDPPADDEINYYILMKKYVRSLISFFDAPYGTGILADNKFGYYSPFYHFYHMDILTDLKENMVDVVEFVSDLDIRNGSSIKPLMGIKDDDGANSLICGSKERTTQFYRHKFLLASLDLRSSESTFLPPFSEERKSYLQVLDHLASSSPIGEPDEVSVYSDELYKLFLERIESVMSDMNRLSTRIIHLLVEKLSLTEWESIYSGYMGRDLSEKFMRESVERQEPFPIEEYERQHEAALEQWRKKIAEKYRRMSTEEELPAYIACIDRCLQIAYQTGVSSLSRITKYRRWFQEMQTAVNSLFINNAGWAALHSLTLLEPPSGSSLVKLLREQAVLRKRKMKGKTAVPIKLQHNAKWMKKCIAQGEDENDNLKLKRKDKWMRKCVAQGMEDENGNLKLEQNVKWMSKCVAEGKEDENDNLKLKRKAKLMSKCVPQGMEDENGNLKLDQNAKWMRKCVAQRKEDENENVHLLKGIIKALKHIGDSNVKPDKEETQLLNKIWQNIVASVHFFKCAVAYEQRYYIILCGGLPDDAMDGLRTRKRQKTSGDVKDISDLFWEMGTYFPSSFEILKEYKVVLTKKLEEPPNSVKTNCS